MIYYYMQQRATCSRKSINNIFLLPYITITINHTVENRMSYFFCAIYNILEEVLVSFLEKIKVPINQVFFTFSKFLERLGPTKFFGLDIIHLNAADIVENTHFVLNIFCFRSDSVKLLNIYQFPFPN